MRNSHNGLEWADHMKKEGSNWRAWLVTRIHGSTVEQRWKGVWGEGLSHISIWKKTVALRHSEAETSLYDPMTAAPSCVSVSLCSGPWPINTIAWSLDVGWNKVEGGNDTSGCQVRMVEGGGLPWQFLIAVKELFTLFVGKKSFHLLPHVLYCYAILNYCFF